MNNRKYANLIFDLGGVIIDLDPNKTLQELAVLTDKHIDDVRDWFNTGESFKLHEKGLISDDDFRSSIREQCRKKVSDKEIDYAWNAMLLDLPVERLQLLKKLRADHSVFLLSNTNNIHLLKVTERLHDVGQQSFDPFFDQQYYSHLVNERKPDEAIFQIVLDDNNLDPKKTLFLDDSLTNLDGASKLGIQTFHVSEPDAVNFFFNE